MSFTAQAADNARKNFEEMSMKQKAGFLLNYLGSLLIIVVLVLKYVDPSGYKYPGFLQQILATDRMMMVLGFLSVLVIIGNSLLLVSEKNE